MPSLTPPTHNQPTADRAVPTTSDVVELRSSDQILERVKRLHPKRIDLSLGRMERLLQQPDHPEQKLPVLLFVLIHQLKLHL